MVRTESNFFDDYVDLLVGQLDRRVEEIESTGTYGSEDEMELAALDRLIVALESLC